MNSVSWFGHFPHRLSVELSVGLLRAAAGLGLPARAFLNLEIRGLLPPGSVRHYPRHWPKSPPPCGGGGAVFRNALQPFPRAYRETYSPTRKAASLKADGQPRALHPKHWADCLRQTALRLIPLPKPAACRLVLYEAQIREVPYIYIILFSFLFF